MRLHTDISFQRLTQSLDHNVIAEVISVWTLCSILFSLTFTSSLSCYLQTLDLLFHCLHVFRCILSTQKIHLFLLSKSFRQYRFYSKLLGCLCPRFITNAGSYVVFLILVLS